MKDQQTIFYSKNYEEHVLDVWLNKKGLYEAEKYLLDTYLQNKKGKVCEAGTGSGRLMFYLEKAGFTDITGFDLSKRMITKGNERKVERNSKIQFDVADARNLYMYKDEEFDYLVYLQQLLSMIPENDLKDAIEEAYRIGSTTGTYIFSFMDWESRWYNPYLSFVLNSYRWLTFGKVSKYYLPELKNNKRINTLFFHKDQHAVLWAKKNVIEQTIRSSGFKIDKFYRQKDISKGSNDLAMYFICSKNS